MLAARGCLGLAHRGSSTRWLATKAGPLIMKANVDAYGEGATALVSKEQFQFLVDESTRLGGKGIGPNPLTLLLGSLVGCTQYTVNFIAKEMKLGGVAAVSWSAEGEYDMRGVRGNEPGVDARFRRISLQGTFDTDMSQQELDRVAEQVDRRCLVAATLKASGLDMQLSMKKGEVGHNCQPACALHDLEAQGQGGVTGRMTGQPGRHADDPRFVGTGGRGRASARAYTTLPYLHCRSLHTSGAWSKEKDGEDIAREHMGAEATPQLQKETSDKGAPTTAGGAYASRDDPRSQASQPTSGKSDEQIVQEQGAGAYVHPQEAGAAEGGKPMKPAHSPHYAGEESADEIAADEKEEEALGRELDRSDFEPWKE